MQNHFWWPIGGLARRQARPHPGKILGRRCGWSEAIISWPYRQWPWTSWYRGASFSCAWCPSCFYVPDPLLSPWVRPNKWTKLVIIIEKKRWRDIGKHDDLEVRKLSVSYLDHSVFEIVIFLHVLAVVNQRESGGWATTELCLETEDRDSVGLSLQLRRKHIGDLFLGNVGQLAVMESQSLKKMIDLVNVTSEGPRYTEKTILLRQLTSWFLWRRGFFTNFFIKSVNLGSDISTSFINQ